MIIYDIRVFIKLRDEWIYTSSFTIRLKVIAENTGLSESRVKTILARMRKERNA